MIVNDSELWEVESTLHSTQAILEAPLPCSMGWIEISAYKLGAGGTPREYSGAIGRIPLQPSRKHEIVEEQDQFGVLSFYPSLIECGPVHLALALVLPPSDHSQQMVEFSCALYPQDDHGICILFVHTVVVCGDAA
jgi:hypothetical protein